MRGVLILLGGVATASVSACGSGDAFEANGTSGGGQGGSQVTAGSSGSGGVGMPSHAGGAPDGEAGQPPDASCTNDDECGVDDSKCAHHACIDAVCALQTLPEGAPCDDGTCNAEHACAASSCDTGKQDGGETGIDCGGACPLKCSLGGGCGGTKDCAIAAGDRPESVRCLDTVCTSTKPPSEGGVPHYWQDFATERLLSGPELCGATDKVCIVGNGATYSMSGIGTNGAFRPLTKALLFTEAGAVGSAGQFDGTLCLTRPGTDLSFLNLGAMTGMAWVKTTRAKAPWESAIIGGFNHYFLAIDANPASQRFLTALATTQSDSFDYRGAAGLGTIKTGEWHHVAAVYSTTAGKLSQYVDGKLVQGTDLTGTTSSSPVSMYIGCRKDAATAAQFFIGSIDEIAMYQRALSPNELSDYVRRTQPTP